MSASLVGSEMCIRDRHLHVKLSNMSAGLRNAGPTPPLARNVLPTLIQLLFTDICVLHAYASHQRM
eukprot:5267705-Alexandrium_andersonii.AAC.1